MNDCPQTETLSGGEDEEGCEGSGQVHHDHEDDHDYFDHVHRHGDAPLDYCDDHEDIDGGYGA